MARMKIQGEIRGTGGKRISTEWAKTSAPLEQAIGSHPVGRVVLTVELDPGDGTLADALKTLSTTLDAAQKKAVAPPADDE